MRRRSEVIWRNVDGKVVGLDLRTSRYFSLNASGSALWSMLEDETDVAALVDRLTAGHGVDPGRVTGDVEAFLESLRSHGLLEN